MYRGLRIIAIAPVLDERAKIGQVVARMPRDLIDEVVIVDDGSRDESAAVVREAGATVLRWESPRGVGAALRRGYGFAVEHGFDVAVVVAGNNKDSPEEIPRLLDPIVEDRADFVQGSRYLERGADLGDMPFYRRVATRLHPILFSLAARQRVTDSTNGFRAIHRRVLADERIDLSPAWLDRYELEPYLFLSAIRNDFRVIEVPVTKRYPPRHVGQTKMRPIRDWWSILRPVILVGLGLRR